MIDTANVEFSGNIRDEIIKCLRVLYTTPAGTVANDRDFGIDYSFVDLPMLQAKAKLTKEIIEKTKKYEPRVAVNAVTFDYDALSGVMKPRVKLNAIN